MMATVINSWEQGALCVSLLFGFSCVSCDCASAMLATPTPKTLLGIDRSLLVVCICLCSEWSPVGLRAPAISLSQDWCM